MRENPEGRVADGVFFVCLPDYWRIQGIQQAICADVNQILWAVFDPSMILHIHVQHIMDTLSLEFDLESLVIVPFALADRTGQPNIR